MPIKEEEEEATALSPFDLASSSSLDLPLRRARYEDAINGGCTP